MSYFLPQTKDHFVCPGFTDVKPLKYDAAKLKSLAEENGLDVKRAVEDYERYEGPITSHQIAYELLELGVDISECRI